MTVQCRATRLKVEVCEDGVNAIILPPLEVRLHSGHMPKQDV